MNGLDYAKSLAFYGHGLIFIPGEGLVMKVRNPNRNRKMARAPQYHILTFKGWIRREMGLLWRAPGTFTPVRLRYSAMADGHEYKIVARRWDPSETDIEDRRIETKGAAYGILWTPPEEVTL